MSAKNRVLQYIDSQGISKYKFYKETGLSYGYLDKGENIDPDKGQKIYDTYPNLNPEWVKTGEGEMFIESSIKEYAQTDTKTNEIRENLIEYSNNRNWKEEYFFEVERHSRTKNTVIELQQQLDKLRTALAQEKAQKIQKAI